MHRIEVKVLFVTGAVLVSCFSLWAGAKGLNAATTVSFLTAMAFLFFAHIDQITKFKASLRGIETETREVIQRAEVTLAQLQELATLMGKIQISLLVRQWRLGGYSESEQEKFRHEILTVLERIGVSAERRDDSLSEVRRFARFDYVSKLLAGPPQGFPADKVEERNALKNRLPEDPPKPQELEAFLKSAGVFDDERKEWLEDYRHYLRSNSHRRPEIWNQRNG